MKPEQFILNNKYRYKNNIFYKNHILIYVAIDKTDDRRPHLFIYKDKDAITKFSKLWDIDFSFVKDLNLIKVDEDNDDIRIKDYSYFWPEKHEYSEFEVILKHKLKNILNR